MKTTVNFSSKMGMTSLPSLTLENVTHAEAKAQALAHYMEHGGKSDTHYITLVFPDPCSVKRKPRLLASSYTTSGHSLGPAVPV